MPMRFGVFATVLLPHMAAIACREDDSGPAEPAPEEMECPALREAMIAEFAALAEGECAASEECTAAFIPTGQSPVAYPRSSDDTWAQALLAEFSGRKDITCGRFSLGPGLREVSCNVCTHRCEVGYQLPSPDPCNPDVIPFVP